MSLQSVDDHKRNGVVADEKLSDDKLLSLTAHELRTPLSVIKWYTEMLLDGDCGILQGDQIKYVKTIQSSNEQAINLVRSLLNLSRLNSDTFSIIPVKIDLRTVLKEVLTDFKDMVAEKKIITDESYENSSQELFPTIQLDKQMCVVIFRNLISNAILFSKEGGKVCISIKEMKQGEEYSTKVLQEDSLVVSITDSGIGIPKKDKEHIFSKLFYKASNLTTEQSKGAGLGLYITKHILEKTRGDIWFTSNDELGSTFYVSFPKSGIEKKEGRTKLD